MFVKEGYWPGLHIHASRVEVAGVVDEVGVGVTVWKKGQRVGWDGMAAIVVNAILAGVVTSWDAGTSR